MQYRTSVHDHLIAILVRLSVGIWAVFRFITIKKYYLTYCHAKLYESIPSPASIIPLEEDLMSRESMREIQRLADRVCVLILSSDLPAIDIEIEKNKVRQRCLELFPDRELLFDMIYESRFQRLWQQFREAE
jgi:hypothetical protein